MASPGATLWGARGSCTCTTLGGSHRQPRAVYKYWAQVRLCGHAATYSSSVRRTVDGAFTVLRQSGGYRRYVTETGTHSVKLYVVVETPVIAQMRIPMILQLQYIDKMVDVCCAGPASSGSGREETVEIPQLQLVSFLVVHTPVVCNDRCPWSMSSCISSTFLTSL